MPYSLARRATATISLYVSYNASLYAEEASLFQRLQDPKDLIVGIVAGLTVILLLSWRVPKLSINKNIVERKGDTEKGIGTGEPRLSIQVLNRRRWWFLFTGDAIDLNAELHVIKFSDKGREIVVPLHLVRFDPLILPSKRRFGLQQGKSEYLFDVSTKSEGSLKQAITDRTPVRFRLYARDGLSNYGRVFTIYYKNQKDLTWFERAIRRLLRIPLKPVVIGNLSAPGYQKIDELN